MTSRVRRNVQGEAIDGEPFILSPMCRRVNMGHRLRRRPAEWTNEERLVSDNRNKGLPPRPLRAADNRLEPAGGMAENSCMVIAGRVQNGVVVEEGAVLPEGAAVIVSYPLHTSSEPPAQRKRIELPLIRTNQPQSVPLTNERIAEVLDEEDLAPRH